MSIIKKVLSVVPYDKDDYDDYRLEVRLKLEKGFGWTRGGDGELDCWNVVYYPNTRGFDSCGRPNDGTGYKDLDFEDFLCHYERHLGYRQITEYKLEFSIWE